MTLLYEYSLVNLILYNEFYGLHYLMNLFNFCLNLLSCSAYFHETYCAHSRPSGFARNMYGLNFFITVLGRMLCIHFDYLTSHPFFMCTHKEIVLDLM
jgi:hypothetical protein